MKLHVYLSILLVTLFSYAWVDCANVPSCAHMSSWFPGTPPSNHSENLPYQLSVHGHTEYGYFPGSSHTVYLNGSKSFVGFIVYSENSVKNYTNGRFVQEDLPSGVEEVSCGDLYIIQNSTWSGSWTSVKMIWKSPQSYKAGNITFRASVLESTNPLVYYEGFIAHLKYQCPLPKCVQCPTGVYRYDSYGCNTCQCLCDMICADIYAPVCGTDGKTYGNECEMNRQACEKKSSITKKHSGKCKRCDMVCTQEYRPVCGTDEKTYGNKCAMEARACENNKTVTVSYNGECSGLCDMICADIYAPVCGTDGKTYGNECEMNRQACEKKSSITKKHSGKCISLERCDMVCTLEYRPVCGTDEKTYGNKCFMEARACENNKTVTVSYDGECSGLCDMICADIYAPVCGTDGKTYGNECEMNRQACEKKSSITKKHSGKCSAEETVKFSVLSLMFSFLAFLLF